MIRRAIPAVLLLALSLVGCDEGSGATTYSSEECAALPLGEACPGGFTQCTVRGDLGSYLGPDCAEYEGRVCVDGVVRLDRNACAPVDAGTSSADGG